MLFFFKISANFLSHTIINIAGLLELAIQTKTFSISNANKKSVKNCYIFKNYVQSRYR